MTVPAEVIELARAVPRVTGMLYGGDYNPEQWPEETWLEDVELMREAGVNLVSVGIFSWALLEPEEEVYDFAWLDRVIDLLWSNGIAIDLATPTASPPAWLARRYPEVLPVTDDGVRLELGSRRHACPSSPILRAASVRIAEQLARRYGSHPALAMWHVSNEYGCHLPACYCEVSAAHFRRWLETRYGSLAELNRVWGTAFWGQRYGSFDQIAPPRRTPASVNPTQALDWRRFCSDAFLECFEAERDVLAAATPDVPVTTNFMCRFQPVDYWKWAGREDVVTLDSYPDPSDPEAHIQAALDYDLTRSLAAGRPWLLLEHATGAVNWRPVNVPKRPGQMRLWAKQAVARGSDGAMFFQWRAARAGAEKFHSGMVPHAGRRARGWRETVALGDELRALAEVAGTTVEADVAILFDWDNWWAFDGADHPSQLLDLQRIVLDWYRPLFAANVAVDFAHPAQDLSGYRLVVAPGLHLATTETLGAAHDLRRGRRRPGDRVLQRRRRRERPRPLRLRRRRGHAAARRARRRSLAARRRRGAARCVPLGDGVDRARVDGVARARRRRDARHVRRRAARRAAGGPPQPARRRCRPLLLGRARRRRHGRGRACGMRGRGRGGRSSRCLKASRCAGVRAAAARTSSS